MNNSNISSSLSHNLKSPKAIRIYCSNKNYMSENHVRLLSLECEQMMQEVDCEAFDSIENFYSQYINLLSLNLTFLRKAKSAANSPEMKREFSRATRSIRKIQSEVREQYESLTKGIVKFQTQLSKRIDTALWTSQNTVAGFNSILMSSVIASGLTNQDFIVRPHFDAEKLAKKSGLILVDDVFTRKELWQELKLPYGRSTNRSAAILGWSNCIKPYLQSGRPNTAYLKNFFQTYQKITKESSGVVFVRSSRLTMKISAERIASGQTSRNAFTFIVAINGLKHFGRDVLKDQGFVDIYGLTETFDISFSPEEIQELKSCLFFVSKDKSVFDFMLAVVLFEFFHYLLNQRAVEINLLKLEMNRSRLDESEDMAGWKDQIKDRKKFAWLRKVNRQAALGYCAECGNPLSKGLSLSRGIGPVCWEKLTHEKRTWLKERHKVNASLSNDKSFDDLVYRGSLMSETKAISKSLWVKRMVEFAKL